MPDAPDAPAREGATYRMMASALRLGDFSADGLAARSQVSLDEAEEFIRGRVASGILDEVAQGAAEGGGPRFGIPAERRRGAGDAVRGGTPCQDPLEAAGRMVALALAADGASRRGRISEARLLLRIAAADVGAAAPAGLPDNGATRLRARIAGLEARLSGAEAIPG